MEFIGAAIAGSHAMGVPVGNTGVATEDAVRSTVDLGYDFTVLSDDAALLGAAAREAVVVGRTVAEVACVPASPAMANAERPANIEVFCGWLSANRSLAFDSYAELHRWSVTDIAEFWGSLWAYFDIAAHSPYDCVLGEYAMPGAQWFPGSTLNYVDQIFRNRSAEAIALIEESEPGGPDRRTFSWGELERQVGAVADTLRRAGVSEGDRVVGYLPNIAESVVAFLATATLGAIWASCGQDYSASAAVDRLGQLEPKVLIAADGYRYGGKSHDRRAAIEHIASHMDTVEITIVVPRLGLPMDELQPVLDWSAASAGHVPLRPTPVVFDHPLWVLFSSGTSGRPKGIVHGHGGVVLEHLKSMSFHLDLAPGDVYFWYTSPSWMMWNFQVAGLLVGATIVCYDGSPAFPVTGTLWDLAERNHVTFLGTSPGYLQTCEKHELSPGSTYNLAKLKALGVTGSVLPPTSNRWVAEHVSANTQVVSMTGGTDVVSAFATGVPTEPVRAGEISVIALGAALESWDEQGRSVVGEVGEMVVTKPMPSMPVRFWNDPSGIRYRNAYFDTYPGVWRHGDWITVTERRSVIVHGRSDSTLNRNGIRMGSADIYQAVEGLPEVRESLVIGVEYSDGSYWMPLFVVLADEVQLDNDLIDRIRDVIRRETSPRHVPDDILAAPAIPHTRTGKKLEIPIKRLFQGASADTILDPQSIDDTTALRWYVDLAIQRHAKTVTEAAR
ncbi:acetoacetate--CoA ligase [Nocardia sp. NPDC004860]|uniref:acetoacetate--CoA ligase n=1 Tax=Nocardia sp. NPDC004860 TaxID=3154557 RepID=UPI00339F90D9